MCDWSLGSDLGDVCGVRVAACKVGDRVALRSIVRGIGVGIRIPTASIRHAAVQRRKAAGLPLASNAHNNDIANENENEYEYEYDSANANANKPCTSCDDVMAEWREIRPLLNKRPQVAREVCLVTSALVTQEETGAWMRDWPEGVLWIGVC